MSDVEGADGVGVGGIGATQSRPAYANDALGAVGPVPRPPQFARWGWWSEPDAAAVEALGPPAEYTCHRVGRPLVLDPQLTDEAWARAEWSPPFTRVEDGGVAPLATSVALLWDDAALYVAFRLDDRDVRAVRTGFNDHVYLDDEDIELFVDVGSGYYEFGLNAINVSYQINWIWVGQVVARGDLAALDELLKAPDFLYFVPRPGDALGRHGDLNFQLPGLAHATHIDGSVNSPTVADRGWTAMAIVPWESLAAMRGRGDGPALPPKPGDQLRITSYRAHHRRETNAEPGPGPAPAEGWAWSPVGNANIHVPERWVTVTFTDTPGR